MGNSLDLQSLRHSAPAKHVFSTIWQRCNGSEADCSVPNVSFLRQFPAEHCQTTLAGAASEPNHECLKFSCKYVPNLVRLTALTQWFNRRTQGTGPNRRARRIAVVAVARRLAIALWRYLKDGVIPEGAQLKPAGQPVRCAS
ncbi:hypothetical protein P0D88_47760 [Paraburkholderia sp. RL18-103-BIB-C]